MARELPKIDVAGEFYFIDLRLNELRHVDDFMNRIFIDHDLHERGDKYLLAYDKDNKCAFRGGQEEFAARSGKGVIVVELPSLQQMDPVGFEWLCENFDQHQRHMNSLLRFADQCIHALEAQRIKKQLVAMSLLKRKRERNTKGRKR